MYLYIYIYIYTKNKAITERFFKQINFNCNSMFIKQLMKYLI